MFETSRRDFIFGLGAVALFPLERTEPDLILYNGNLWTVDKHLPRAEAVAISAGRFVAVGSNEDVLRLAAARSRKIDLGMKTAVPGFIDAASSGRSHLRRVDCDCGLSPQFRLRSANAPPKPNPQNGSWALSMTTPRHPKDGCSISRTSMKPCPTTRF